MADPAHLSFATTAARLAAGAGFGALVGAERESADHDAGLRTHTLLALGAAIFGVLSVGAFGSFVASRNSTDISMDPTRIASYVAAGVGFIGGGAILKRGDRVKGLTTAASLWVVAAVGLASGLGFWPGAVMGTVICGAALAAGRFLDRWLNPRERGHRLHPSPGSGADGPESGSGVARVPGAGASGDLPCIRSLDELAELVDGRPGLYLRWSKGLPADEDRSSRDELTGVDLPGLSANALSVEAWWHGRSAKVWVARRLYDYEHLQRRKPGTRPWVLSGEECGRGPDNEPLVRGIEPIAWIAPEVADEARAMIDRHKPDWGSLDRSGT